MLSAFCHLLASFKLNYNFAKNSRTQATLKVMKYRISLESCTTNECSKSVGRGGGCEREREKVNLDLKLFASLLLRDSFPHFIIVYDRSQSSASRMPRELIHFSK